MKMGAPKWPPSPQRSSRPGPPVTLLDRPPPSGFRSLNGSHCSWIHRGRGEAGALVAAKHHVEVLDAIGGAPLAEIVDGGQADGSACPMIGDHGDVAVIGPDDAARRRSFAF